MSVRDNIYIVIYINKSAIKSLSSSPEFQWGDGSE